MPVMSVTNAYSVRFFLKSLGRKIDTTLQSTVKTVVNVVGAMGCVRMNDWFLIIDVYKNELK